MMRISNLLSISGVIIAAAACGGDAAGRDAEESSPPVAIWRPDTAAAAAVRVDTGGSSAGDTTFVSEDPVGIESVPAAVEGGGAAEQSSGVRASAEAGSPEPSNAGTSTAEAVLLRAERAYDAVRTLRADFLQDLDVPLLASTQRSRGEIFHRKPDRFLMRFSDPEGDLVVADGRYLWLYYPSTDPKQVVRTSMGQAGRLDLQREFLSNPTERFTATLDGSERVAGRPAKALTLVPRGESPYRRVRIWIDDQDALARRFEITENNDNIRVVELRNLSVNADLPDELFSFTPPAGTEVFDQ